VRVTTTSITREFPAKGLKKSGLDFGRSCVKRGRKCKSSSELMVDRGLCATSGAIVKLVCWCQVDILDTECESDSNKSSSDLDVFRNVHECIFMLLSDVINFTDCLI